MILIHAVFVTALCMIIMKYTVVNVTAPRIDAAESPAGVLQDLCERSGFGPEAALEFHKQLYRQKLQQLLTKKKLTDEDSEELKRIRRILCIRKEDADAVAKNTAGVAGTLRTSSLLSCSLSYLLLCSLGYLLTLSFLDFISAYLLFRSYTGGGDQ